MKLVNMLFTVMRNDTGEESYLLVGVAVNRVDVGEVVVVGHIPVEVLIIVVHPGGPTTAVVVMARCSTTPDIEPKARWRTVHSARRNNRRSGLK